MTSSEEGEGERDEEGGESNLLMPSMRISLARMPARSSAEREKGLRGPSAGERVKLGRARRAEGGAPSTTVLLLGKTSHERQVLARLLSKEQSHQQQHGPRQREASVAATDDGENFAEGGDHEHMSASFLSTTSAGASLASERSRSSSSSHRLSTAHSDPPASPSPAAVELPSVFSPLPSAPGLTFLQSTAIPDLAPTSLLPSSHITATLATTTAELATALRTPLERLESKLNPLYPTSRGLGELVDSVFSSDFQGGVDACLMLMSSRTFFPFRSSFSRSLPPSPAPTPPEILLARTISPLLPLFPILILPPNGRKGRKQKTEALVAAVGVQLGRGGVRWVDACAGGGGEGGEIYLLPDELFRVAVEEDGNSATGSGSGSGSATSLSSSQELPPAPPSPALSSLPSTRHTSRSHSNTSLRSASASSSTSSSRSPAAAAEGDLKRLRELVGSAEGRERLEREKVDAFLEWREVEVAARGVEQGVVVESAGGGAGGGGLESWGEELWEFGGEAGEGVGARRRREERELGFSRRVGERRAELGLQMARSRGEGEGSYQRQEREDLLHPHQHHPASSSLFTDPTTPRCIDRSALSLPPFSFASLSASTTSSPSLPSFSNTQTPISPSLASSAFGAAPPANPTSVLAVPDPFHLPSLLHLVGLNIRLALLPISHLSSSQSSTTSPPSESEKAPSSPSSDKNLSHHHRPSAAGWTAAVLSFGVVFLAGVVVGGGLGGGGAAGGGESAGVGVGCWGVGAACRGWRGVGRW